MLACMAKRAYYQGGRIYSNFHLNLDGKTIDFQTRRKNGDLNYTPIFQPEDLSGVSSGSWIFIDELDVLGIESNEDRGVDSYSYRNEASTLAERYLKKKLRKKHCKIRFTIQQLNMTPSRIRAETLEVYEPHIVQRAVTIKGEMVPYVVHFRTRVLDNIDGLHKLTPDLRQLVHPVFGYPDNPHPTLGIIKTVTQDMLDLYDTYSDAFRPSDAKRLFGMKGEILEESGELIYPNEKNIYEKLKKALPEASIILYPRSGHNLRRCGDMEFTLPIDYHIPTIIIEAKGVDNYDKAGNVRMIKTTIHDGSDNTHGMNWSDAMAHDVNYNTIHLCAFSNPKTMEVFLFSVKDNYEYIQNKKRISISKLSGVMSLKDFTDSIKNNRKKGTVGESILATRPIGKRI